MVEVSHRSKTHHGAAKKLLPIGGDRGPCGRYVSAVPTNTQSTASGSGKTYDVVVVGAGHNGLTCAAFLAKAGKRVLVLEARDTVGGLVWTMEMANAPGFKVSPCSVEFVLPGVEPSIVDQLELHKHGPKRC